MKTNSNNQSELNYKNFSEILKCIDMNYINYMIAIC